MRRLTLLSLALAVLAALCTPAHAQFQLIGPGGIVNASATSVTISNTTTATSIYSFTAWPALTTYPLHLKLSGTLQTNAANNTCAACTTFANIGCNFGTTASLTLASAQSLPSNAGATTYPIPIVIDIYTRPFTLVGGFMPYMFGTVASATAPNLYMAASYIQANTADPSGTPVLSCSWQFSSASTANVLTILNATTVIGN